MARECATNGHAWFLCMVNLIRLAAPLDVGGVRIRNR
ncbi:MAG: tRNA dihydrouridine synthase DusB, partial [Mesorhizobium sp.]